MKQVIKAYLDNRAANDELFAVAYEKPNKSIDQCCKYILGEAKKKGNAVYMSDEEVYGLAVHYYDEDDIKISVVPGGVKVSAPATTPSPQIKVEITDEDRAKAKELAMEKLVEEQRQAMKRKPKKRVEEVVQPSLFD